MSTTSQVWVGLVAVLLIGRGLASPCFASGTEPEGKSREEAARIDEHSFSNPAQVRVWQIAFDLGVDFDRREIKGVAILDIQRQPRCPPDVALVLDTRGLTIEEVGLRKMTINPGGFAPTRYQLGPVDPVLGSRLTITLTPEATQVRIAYRTAPSAGALQWLNPSLTAGKVKPFLFTQSEAIHARSWIPLQDSPGVRINYVGTIRVPKGLTAVMAAESRVRPEEASQGVFRFVMSQPIPSYLIALAVGDLAFQKLGPRTGV
jgi:leukotriene-A4 hydrolase